MPSAPQFHIPNKSKINLSVEDRCLLRKLETSLKNLQEENRKLVQQIWDADKELSNPICNPEKKEMLKIIKKGCQEQITNKNLLTKIAEKQAAIAILLAEPASSPSPIVGFAFSH